MSKYDYPHIYKKGKILRIKKLGLNDEVSGPKYTFRSTRPTLQNIVNHCNNMNQILANYWFKLSKLLSYFGLQKDLSDELRKDKSRWNGFKEEFSPLLKKGNSSQKVSNSHDVILEYLNDIDNKLPSNLVIEKGLELIITDFDGKLEEIRQSIKQVVG